MLKKDFRKLIIHGTSAFNKKYEKPCVPSVTDPTYAQSGREMIINPLPYETKPIYQNGIPLDQMQSFDGMYVDKFDAFRSAKEFAESNIKDIKKKLKDIEDGKNQPINPDVETT